MHSIHCHATPIIAVATNTSETLRSPLTTPVKVMKSSKIKDPVSHFWMLCFDKEAAQLVSRVIQSRKTQTTMFMEYHSSNHMAGLQSAVPDTSKCGLAASAVGDTSLHQTFPWSDYFNGEKMCYTELCTFSVLASDAVGDQGQNLCTAMPGDIGCFIRFNTSRSFSGLEMKLSPGLCKVWYTHTHNTPVCTDCGWFQYKCFHIVCLPR